MAATVRSRSESESEWEGQGKSEGSQEGLKRLTPWRGEDRARGKDGGA